MAGLDETLRSDELKVHRDNGGTYSSPTWSQLTTINAKDYERVREVLKTMFDGSQFVGNRLGKQEVKLDLKGDFRPGDTDLIAIKAAQKTNVATELIIGVAFGTITVAGVLYDKMPMVCSRFKLGAEKNGIVQVEFTLELGDVLTNAPVFDTAVPS
mgnify:CR=1 FL=1|tara:strand:- start:8019 stop:8486 length:468 start_codon:yes stop_codon:yes gene_type:complete